MSPAASTAREAGALAADLPFGDREADHFLPAEAEPSGGDGGGLGTPAARPSSCWLGRTRATLRDSVWAKVALKLVGLALAMVALSGIGVASVLSGANGVPVPLSDMLGADLHAAWLANKSATGSRASSGPSALTTVSATHTVAEGATSNRGPANGATSSAGPASAGSNVSTPVDAQAGAHASASSGMTEDGKVILNLANTEDLRHLPGVGPKRAEAILALRARLGHFKQVNDLLRVKGIGVRGLKKIVPHVVLDAPKPSA